MPALTLTFGEALDGRIAASPLLDGDPQHPIMEGFGQTKDEAIVDCCHRMMIVSAVQEVICPPAT